MFSCQLAFSAVKKVLIFIKILFEDSTSKT